MRQWAEHLPELAWIANPESGRIIWGNHRWREYIDEYLAFTDAEIGRLLDNLEQQGILDNTYVILTSDHGELFECGIRGHVTLTLYEGLTHIPLMIHKPGQQSREDVFQRTTAADILPTLLHLTGQPIPQWVEGAVLPTFGGATAPTDRMVYSIKAKSNPSMRPLPKPPWPSTRMTSS